MPVLLLDVYDRMHTSSLFSLNPGKSRAVFLPEVPVDGYTIKDVTTLKQLVYGLMEQELIRQGVSWLHTVKTAKA
jgi:1-acyl-sn-glycerol-3-phosphate acyltransferase